MKRLNRQVAVSKFGSVQTELLRLLTMAMARPCCDGPWSHHFFPLPPDPSSSHGLSSSFATSFFPFCCNALFLSVHGCRLRLEVFLISSNALPMSTSAREQMGLPTYHYLTWIDQGHWVLMMKTQGHLRNKEKTVVWFRVSPIDILTSCWSNSSKHSLLIHFRR